MLAGHRHRIDCISNLVVRKVIDFMSSLSLNSKKRLHSCNCRSVRAMCSGRGEIHTARAEKEAGSAIRTRGLREKESRRELTWQRTAKEKKRVRESAVVCKKLMASMRHENRNYDNNQTLE